MGGSLLAAVNRAEGQVRFCFQTLSWTYILPLCTSFGFWDLQLTTRIYSRGEWRGWQMAAMANGAES